MKQREAGQGMRLLMVLAFCLFCVAHGQEGWLSPEDGCPPGTHVAHPPSGEHFCRWCEPGTYQAGTNAEACAACRPGTVSGEIGATSAHACKSCGRDTYAAGRTECAPCPPNTESPGGAVDARECTPLPGHYAARNGEAATECPANHFCAQGVRAPAPCPDGTFTPPGSEACIPGTPAVLLLDWIFVAAWLVLVSSGVLALGVYRHALRQAKPAAVQAGGVIKVQIVR